MSDPHSDPLEAETSKKAIGVAKSNGVLLAVGDEVKEEWIRFETDGFKHGEYAVEE